MGFLEENHSYLVENYFWAFFEVGRITLILGFLEENVGYLEENPKNM